MKYRYIQGVLLTFVAVAIQAQNINSAYFMEDYKFRHAMNPAFDNETNYISIPALGNIAVNTQGNFGYEAVVLPNPLAGQPGQKSMTSFMNPYIDNNTALSGFSTGNNRVVGNVNVSILSVGFKGWGGYNTIELNSKTSFGVALPYELLEFAKNTQNNSYDIGDISAGAMSYIELAFGHSRKITEKLRLGAKLKVLLGVGRADLRMENVKAELNGENRWLIQGNSKVDVSIKNFRYIEKNKDYKSEERGSYRRVNDIKVDKFGLNGFGLAIDLGGVYTINQDWIVSASLLDIGFLSWSNDVLARNINNQFEFGGFHDASVTNKRPGENGTFEHQSDEYLDQIVDFINVQDQGDQGGRMTGIGATVNIGASYNLPSYRKLTFGLLSSTRLNGDYSWTEARLSTNWAPLKWLNGDVNVAVSSFTTSVGWLLNIHPRGYNFFIGMDHILGKLSKEGIPLTSNASINIGMNITW